MPNSKKEKRKYARLDIRSDINLSVMDVSKETATAMRMKAVGEDIAVHGVRFATDRKLKKDDIVSMEIFLPDNDSPIYVEGEVRWCKKKEDAKKKYDVGINFLTFDEDNILTLLKCVGGDLVEK